MQAPYNDRWERTKRHLLRNFLVNPGFRLSPVPEEERSSPSSDTGSLPDLLVEPEPDRHDHPPEYYEGLERRMKRSYRKLFLGARSDDDGSSDSEVNQSMASTFMLDTNTRKDTEAKIVAERAGFDRNHSISKKRQSTKSINEIHEDDASEDQDKYDNKLIDSCQCVTGHVSVDSKSSNIEDEETPILNESGSIKGAATKYGFIRRLSSHKSDVFNKQEDEYTPEPETETERLLTASEITRASIDSDNPVDTEINEDDPSKLDTDEDDETEITGIQNTSIDWYKDGTDDDEDCFDNAIRRGEFTSKARKMVFITSSEESFDDLEPLAQSSAISIDEAEVMREARGSGVNESWHGEAQDSPVAQDSSALAFEGQTDADKLENESSVSTEINASYEQEIEQATEAPQIDAIAKITDEFWSVSPMEDDIEEPKEPRGSKRRTDSEGGATAKRRQKDVAIQTGLEEDKTWEDIRTEFFVGSPLVYRLCGCPDHVCS